MRTSGHHAVLPTPAMESSQVKPFLLGDEMKEKPSLDYLKQRITVDIEHGIIKWVDATKFHCILNGRPAGTLRVNTRHDKAYWYIKIDGVALKRSHIVFLFATGQWPSLQIDHINGNSLDDRFMNLREATAMQNSWNHKKRAKKSEQPMGVRELPSGKFQARLTCDKRQICLGSYKTSDEAAVIYQQKRKEMFGDYA